MPHTLISIIIPLYLCTAGLYFTVRFRGFYLLHPVRSVRYGLSGGEKGKSRSATLLALSETLGVGNVTGVAAGIAVGGPGILFWMWVSSLLSMGLHYAEIVLTLDGSRRGRLPRYLPGGAFGRLFLLSLVLLSFSLGGGLQSEAVAASFSKALDCTKGAAILFAVLPVSLAVVLFRRQVGQVATALIPLAVLVYTVLCSGVIVTHAEKVPAVFALILRDAFSSPGTAGIGTVLTVLSRAGVGIRRGMLSSEAGCGTAAAAHAEAVGAIPAAEGLFGVFEVGFDTLFLCTLTGLALLASGTGGGDITACLSAFHPVFGRFASPLLSLSVLLFAAATSLCYCKIGHDAAVALFGRRGEVPYFLLFLLSLSLGALFPVGILLSLSDLTLGVLSAINLTCLIKNADRVVALSADLLGCKERGGGITPAVRRRIQRRGSSKGALLLPQIDD